MVPWHKIRWHNKTFLQVEMEAMIVQFDMSKLLVENVLLFVVAFLLDCNSYEYAFMRLQVGVDVLLCLSMNSTGNILLISLCLIQRTQQS